MEWSNNAVYLKRSEVLKLKKKLIGKGTDGCVYDMGNGYLFKIYHDVSFFSNIKVHSHLLDKFEDEDIKIAQRGMYSFLKENCPYFKYVDSEGVRIRGDHAIYLAMEKQKNIKRTSLPLAPIYVDSRFKGCVLKKHAFHLHLHSLMCLPKEYKSKILLSIIDNVDELLSSNIYHLDIANFPNDKSRISHSNILVSLSGVPQLIDVDGKSAVYLENDNSYLYQICIRGLNFLILKFYYDIDIPDEVFEEDFNEFERLLYEQGVQGTDMENLLYQDCDLPGLRKILTK